MTTEVAIVLRGPYRYWADGRVESRNVGIGLSRAAS